MGANNIRKPWVSACIRRLIRRPPFTHAFFTHDPSFAVYGYRLPGGIIARRLETASRARTRLDAPPDRGVRRPGARFSGRNASRYSYGRVMAHATWVETRESRVSRGRDVHVDDAQATAISCVDNIVPRVTGLGSSGVPCTPPVARYSDTAASHGLQRSSP